MRPAQLAELCAAALPEERLTTAELDACCYGPDSVVVGDDEAAAAVLTRRFGDVAVAWILLLAVHPAVRQRGRARALVERIVGDARTAGVSEIHLGNAAPRYVWAGVPIDLTPAMACFQALGFEPYDHGINMALPTTFRAPVPEGIAVERESGDGAVSLARRSFPHWEDEVARGVEAGGCFSARELATGETIAFACHSVNRRGWIGPMATDPERRSRGVGHALLGALTEDIAVTHSLSYSEISWVAPIPFYAKAGARINRAFRISKLAL